MCLLGQATADVVYKGFELWLKNSERKYLYMRKAIIFDLDGTLWDSSRSCTEAWNRVLEKCPDISRRITIDDMHSYMGKTLDKIAPLALPDTPDERRWEVLKECVRYEQDYIAEHGGELFPHLRDTVELLRQKYTLIIVSNCQDGYIQCFLDFAGMRDLFDDFESAGGTGLTKGENIRLVIQRNAVDSAVYVGDTQGDLDSADFAGVPFIRAAYGFGTMNRPVPEIYSLTELPQTVTEIIG